MFRSGFLKSVGRNASTVAAKAGFTPPPAMKLPAVLGWTAAGLGATAFVAGTLRSPNQSAMGYPVCPGFPTVFITVAKCEEGPSVAQIPEGGPGTGTLVKEGTVGEDDSYEVYEPSFFERNMTTIVASGTIMGAFLSQERLGGALGFLLGMFFGGGLGLGFGIMMAIEMAESDDDEYE